MKDSENKLSSGILYSFIAAAVIIGVLAVTAVRSAGKLSEMYLDSSESSQVMTSELITVKDCIGSAEKNLLEAFSAGNCDPCIEQGGRGVQMQQNVHAFSSFFG